MRFETDYMLSQLFIKESGDGWGFITNAIKHFNQIFSCGIQEDTTKLSSKG